MIRASRLITTRGKALVALALTYAVRLRVPLSFELPSLSNEIPSVMLGGRLIK